MNTNADNYALFVREISQWVPAKRIYTGELLRLAWGTDAGFYRLVPRVVVNVANEQEVSALLSVASRLSLPVTFRAAGTSLSGQSITDSILVVAGKGWEKYSIDPRGETVTLQPGIIGARVNELLAPYQRIFTPDPASKASAMVGGIVMNNASGMNCGTHANSDKMMQSMRIILADGTVVDTAKPTQGKREQQLVAAIDALRRKIMMRPELVEQIKRKYSIKCVTGLNLRPFVEYDNPYDIIAHAMVGSEGTLGFMAECTMLTGPLLPCTASAMAYFADMAEACRAVVALKKEAPEVYSCELLDKKSLSAAADTTGTDLTALLIETRAADDAALQGNIAKIEGVLGRYSLYKPVAFSTDPAVTSKWWQIRSGIFPAVGGTRPLGTTSLIEDIAFPIDSLPEATIDMARLIDECGYDDACIYGHAFEGNYHFVIAQAFNSQADVDKYKHLIERVVELVVDKYGGSLKAEHGTGRNMAPFVEVEWGAEAYQIMKEIKQAFDPQGLLNPGVIFNDDPLCYLRNFKPLPITDPVIDKCIECGFCEVNCVSCGFTLSARQRIATQREISQLRASGSDPVRLGQLQREYKYLGEATCAADGLCSMSCPMGINTADLTHKLRQQVHPQGSTAHKVGDWAATHLSTVESTLKPVLEMADVAHSLMGDSAVAAIGKALHKTGLPLWTPSLPKPRYGEPRPSSKHQRKVVYFPSCINQTMGPSRIGGKTLPSLIDTMVELCNKAGYEVIFPADMHKLCCGLTWESKGMPDIADRMTAQLEQALRQASCDGLYPVVCDQSPCLHRMRQHIKGLRLYEPAEFIADYLAEHLQFTPVHTPVAVHVTCSSRLMGLAPKIIGLAKRCSTQVLVPEEVGCCGFAGDKGFTHPELNAWALRKLKAQVESHGAVAGYSNSRTCEIGLTTNSGIPYQSIAYLVNQVTTPK